MGFNKMILVGNLGRDPELRYSPQGTPICQFSLATDDFIKQGGERVKHTTWYRVTVWGRLAESCSQYLARGKKCYVEGRHRTEEWTDRDGKARYTNEVSADRVQFLDPKDDTESRDKFSADSRAMDQQRRDEANPNDRDINDDDVPF